MHVDIIHQFVHNSNLNSNFFVVLSSLCDVGSLLSSRDIKTSIETWRTVVKLSEQLHNFYLKLSIIKTESSADMERKWNRKAILGILKELNQILHLYLRVRKS